MDFLGCFIFLAKIKEKEKQFNKDIWNTKGDRKRERKSNRKGYLNKNEDWKKRGICERKEREIKRDMRKKEIEIEKGREREKDRQRQTDRHRNEINQKNTE